MIVVGDSLSVGTAPLLAHVRTYARVGRPLAEGLPIIRAHRRAGRLVFALGTNDAPSKPVFRRAVRHVERWRSGRCTVWVTLARRGVDYAPVNRLLRDAPGPTVRWARAVHRHPAWLGPDGVHATAHGYRMRARMIERAATDCRGDALQ